MDLVIEHGAYQDLDAIDRFYCDVNDALAAGINYPGWKKGIYPTRADAAGGIDNRTLFVARSGGEIVGSVILNHEAENGYADAPWRYKGDDNLVFVIHTLAVHPRCCKCGIGVKLMEFAEHLARQAKMKAIRLDVYEKNLPAIQLYERCGYQYIATVDLGLGEHGLDWFKLYEKVL